MSTNKTKNQEKYGTDPLTPIYLKGDRKIHSAVYSFHSEYNGFFLYIYDENNRWTDDELFFKTKQQMMNFCNKLNIKPEKYSDK